MIGILVTQLPWLETVAKENKHITCHFVSIFPLLKFKEH